MKRRDLDDISPVPTYLPSLLLGTSRTCDLTATGDIRRAVAQRGDCLPAAHCVRGRGTRGGNRRATAPSRRYRTCGKRLPTRMLHSTCPYHCAYHACILAAPPHDVSILPPHRYIAVRPSPAFSFQAKVAAPLVGSLSSRAAILCDGAFCCILQGACIYADGRFVFFVWRGDGFSVYADFLPVNVHPQPRPVWRWTKRRDFLFFNFVTPLFIVHYLVSDRGSLAIMPLSANRCDMENRTELRFEPSLLYRRGSVVDGWTLPTPASGKAVLWRYFVADRCNLFNGWTRGRSYRACANLVLFPVYSGYMPSPHSRAHGKDSRDGSVTGGCGSALLVRWLERGVCWCIRSGAIRSLLVLDVGRRPLRYRLRWFFRRGTVIASLRFILLPFMVYLC